MYRVDGSFYRVASNAGRSSNEKAVRPYFSLSAKHVDCDRTEKYVQIFFIKYERSLKPIVI